MKTFRDPTGQLLYLTTSTASYNYLVDTQGNIAAIAMNRPGNGGGSVLARRLSYAGTPEV